MAVAQMLRKRGPTPSGTGPEPGDYATHAAVPQTVGHERSMASEYRENIRSIVIPAIGRTPGIRNLK
jgi:hypothetical protein